MGADVNARDNDGVTPIFMAAIAGKSGSMDCLFDLGVDPKKPDNNGMTLWNIAVMANNFDMQDLLRRKGAKPIPVTPKPASSHFTNVFDAAQGGTVEDIRSFAEKRVDVKNVADKDGMTSLFHAAMNGKIEIIRCLVEEFGADVNVRDNIRATPIFWAAMAGKIDSMDCLYDLGANLNVQDKNGMTIMGIAGLANQTEVQAWLRAKGIR